MERLLGAMTILSLVLIVVILYSVRRSRIRVEYSVSWLAAAIILLVLSRSPGAFNWIAEQLGLGENLQGRRFQAQSGHCRGYGDAEFLTSGEKAGFLAVDRDQIGLGENLQQILGGESFNRGSQVNVRSKQKQVQNVVDGCAWTRGDSARSARGRSWRQGLRTEAAELAG